MNGRTYKCPSHGCGHCYSSKYNVRRHLKAAHPMYNHYTCEHCGKVLSSKQNYNQHLNVHTGAKPFVCLFPGCEKAFRQGSQLSIHKRTHMSPAVPTIPRVSLIQLTDMLGFPTAAEPMLPIQSDVSVILPLILPKSSSPNQVVLRKLAF